MNFHAAPSSFIFTRGITPVRARVRAHTYTHTHTYAHVERRVRFKNIRRPVALSGNEPASVTAGRLRFKDDVRL